MSKLTIDRATLEQLVGTLEFMWRDVAMNEYAFERLEAAITAGRAALANAEPKKFSVTNTAISTEPRTVESFFEAMDKEVAAGRLVRTGPMEWSKPK